MPALRSASSSSGVTILTGTYRGIALQPRPSKTALTTIEPIEVHAEELSVRSGASRTRLACWRKDGHDPGARPAKRSGTTGYWHHRVSTDQTPNAVVTRQHRR